MLLKIAPLVVVLYVSTLSRVFLLVSYYYVAILSLVLARETKIMYNIFLFNFPSSGITMYLVQNCMLLKLALLVVL